MLLPITRATAQVSFQSPQKPKMAIAHIAYSGKFLIEVLEVPRKARKRELRISSSRSLKVRMIIYRLLTHTLLVEPNTYLQC